MIAGSNRAVAEVAAAFGVAWHTAHTALITAAAQWLPAPSPTRVLGIDETRVRRVRWLLEPAGWRRSDPWLTSFVDADTTGPGVLLGLAPGRSGGFVRGTVALRRRMSSPRTKAATRTFRTSENCHKSGIQRSVTWCLGGSEPSSGGPNAQCNSAPGDLPDHHLPTRSQAISGLTSIRASVPFPALIAR